MTDYIEYPDSFQCPQIKPYSLAVDMGVLRTAMDGGNQRQRRRYRMMPHLFNLEFVMQALDLGRWQSWVNQFAYDYFLMDLESMWSALAGSITAPHLVRFISDLQVENVTLGWIRVRVQAEISPNQWALSGPVVPSYQWIVAGTAIAPASPDWIFAGGPPGGGAAPVWIYAGSPRFPAAIVGL
jgi:hypothetical protein